MTFKELIGISFVCRLEAMRVAIFPGGELHSRIGSFGTQGVDKIVKRKA